MKDDLRYRHELKFQIDECQLAVLRLRLTPLTEADEHADETGSYVVRSVYFDDVRNSCYFDNENGNDNRKKFRIRIYNGSDSVIRLEMKHKQSGLTFKENCALGKETAQHLIRNAEIPWDDAYDPLLKKLFVLRRTAALSPKVIVEYDRTPLIFRDGNVRITFDRNIRACDDTASFFENSLSFKPVMPPGRHILEVKYDRVLPDFFTKNIASLGLKQITFSKYYYSRNAGGLL